MAQCQGFHSWMVRPHFLFSWPPHLFDRENAAKPDEELF